MGECGSLCFRNEEINSYMPLKNHMVLEECLGHISVPMFCKKMSLGSH